MIDNNAYFARIGYTGDRSPTLDTLREIHFKHVTTIPFENLNPLLGRPVPLELEALFDKLVHQKRGGYCYEQNLLFRHVLESLGFRVSGLIARVLWNRPEGAITPRSHMLLRIEFDDGSYIVDGGFGGNTLTGPIRLAADLEQATPHEFFRVMQAGDNLRLEAKIHDEWRALYRFSLEEAFLVDYEVANYFTSTNPTSHFTQRLFVARAFPGRRSTLLGNQLTTHYLSAPSEKRILEGAGDVRAVLTDLFGIDVPEGADVDRALMR
jgi:N-hydroxyarylamine O-acetyltransferase